jgi:hypothetical protein
VSGNAAREMRRGAGRSAFPACKRMSILKGRADLSRKDFQLASRSSHTMRILMSCSILAVIVGCPKSRPSQAGAPSAALGRLSGSWRGSNGGLSVTIALRQSGDSVTGSGNFQVAQNASFGCGGESLPSSGSVRLTGQLASGEFQGRMSFADTWTPPYLGVVISPDTLNGHFMSVDRGGCPLVLVRQR